MAPKRKRGEDSSGATGPSSSNLADPSDIRPAVIADDRPAKAMKTMSSFATSFGSGSFRSAVSDMPEHPPAKSVGVPPQPTSSTRPAPGRSARPVTKSKGKRVEVKGIIEIDDSSDDDQPMEGGHSQDDAQPMWTDLYAPKSSADLAPSKTRVKAVHDWLSEAISGIPRALDETMFFGEDLRTRLRKYRRILVLSGPAGVGKTTTVRVLAEELGLGIVEWNEGAEEWGISGVNERESLNSKLLSFLSRNHYTPLPIAVNPDAPGPSAKQEQQSPYPRRILLLSSLPNLSHLPTRQSFHAALYDYCSHYTSAACPLIIIVSDSGSSGRAEEGWAERLGGGFGSDWDVKGVVGKEVMSHPGVEVVDFLPMAPTFLTKALRRIIPLAFTDASKRPSPEALNLISLSANGDLRSAINSLQFLSRNRGTGVLSKSTEGKRNVGKGSRGGKGGAIVGSKDLRALLGAVSRREQSLGLFHALGKVFYNKRIGDSDDERTEDDINELLASFHPDPLPDHLKGFQRKKYENDIETLLGTVPVDTSTFGLWLHQNIAAYCTDVEQMGEALEDMCRAETMKTEDDLWQKSQQAIAYAFHILIRGCVMALPTPVPRLNQKIYKPEFFRYFGVTKECNEALSEVAAWIAQGYAGGGNSNGRQAIASVWGGQLSKTVLAVELLPMMTLIKRGGRRFDDMPDSTALLDLPEFLHPALASNLSPWLEQLTEKEENNFNTEDDFAVHGGLPIKPTMVSSSVHEDRPSWLEGDDIEDW